MICLVCDVDNPYGTEQCASCSTVFRVEPPFVQANHVSQMLTAIDDFGGGKLDRAAFLQRLETFENIFAAIDQTWNFKVPLASRLGNPPPGGTVEGTSPADIEAALRAMDAALEALRAALQRLNALRNPSMRPPSQAEVAVMNKAAALLGDFFRAACSGCATLLHVVENATPSPSTQGLGSLIDIQVS